MPLPRFDLLVEHGNPNMLPWNEDELKIAFQGEGIQPVGNSYAVASGSVNVESEQDKLQARSANRTHN